MLTTYPGFSKRYNLNVSDPVCKGRGRGVVLPNTFGPSLSPMPTGNAMELFSCETYAAGEINDKVVYWVDLWEDLIGNFNQRLYGLDLLNPRVIIEELIDELNWNHLQNEENRNYFREKLSNLRNRDETLNQKSMADFVLLIKEFNIAGNLYLLQLCNTAQALFQDGNYFDEAYERLKGVLLNPNWAPKDADTIAVLSQHLIVELLLKGYSLKSVSSFPRQLFDRYIDLDGRIGTNYPLNTNCRDFVSGDRVDWAAYGSAVKAEMDSLSVPQRLQQFSKYYYSTPTEGYFIFKVVGLKGNADFSIGGVNFYSPWRKKWITQGDSEYFGETEDRHFLNAAVKVSYVDPIAAKMSAIELLEKALDVVRSYLPIKTSLKVRQENYLVANTEALRIGLGRSTSTTSETYKWDQSFDFDSDPIDAIHDGGLLRLFDGISQFLFKSADEQTRIERKIVYSFHWYRKALETIIVEDKLLNYWIVIESLLSLNPSSTNIVLPRKDNETTFTLARELIPPLRISYYVHDIGFVLFWQVRQLVANDKLSLPNTIIEACGLNQPIPGEVDITPFIANMPLLTTKIDHKLLKDRCELTQRFYTDHEFAKEQIEDRIKQIKEDILLIYRYRNRIVHNAHFDSIIVPYFVEKAGIYATELLKRIVNAYTVDRVDSIEEILVTAYVRVKRLLEKLERDIPVDLLNGNF